MADKETIGTEELVQAYNKAVECAVSSMDAGVAQATSAVKLMNEAAENERKEFGKVLEQGAVQSRKRSEELATVLPGIWQGFARQARHIRPWIWPRVPGVRRQADSKRDGLLRVDGPGLGAVLHRRWSSERSACRPRR